MVCKRGKRPGVHEFHRRIGQVLSSPGKRLIGLEQGVQTEIKIPAREAFGERDEDLVRTISLSEFPAGRDLEPGRWATAKSEATGAQYSYLVCEKTDSTITVDYNHPLAGKNLNYSVRVVLVRPALADELEFVRPCEHGQAASQED